LDIYHGSPIMLLAASDVFKECSESIVLLLSDERAKWFTEIFRGADGWYGCCWVTVDDRPPEGLTRFFPDHYPASEGRCYWIVTKAREGNSSHELWNWDGRTAKSLELTGHTCTTDGFVVESDFEEHERSSRSLADRQKTGDSESRANSRDRPST
jgi:hypothetical protein